MRVYRDGTCVKSYVDFATFVTRCYDDFNSENRIAECQPLTQQDGSGLVNGGSWTADWPDGNRSHVTPAQQISPNWFVPLQQEFDAEVAARRAAVRQAEQVDESRPLREDA